MCLVARGGVGALTGAMWVLDGGDVGALTGAHRTAGDGPVELLLGLANEVPGLGSCMMLVCPSVHRLDQRRGQTNVTLKGA